MGTHESCALTLCPALQEASHNGTQQGATLASIGSSEENRLLFKSLLLGRDLWIGLYRSAPKSEGRSQLHDGWRWANEPASPNLASGVRASPSVSVFTNWHRGEPDALYGREDCAYISGATGKWGDYGCELAEMRCLCESGGVPTAAYVEFTSEHAKESERVARQLRQATLVVIALLTAMALPLAIAMTDTTASSGQQLQQRCTVYVGLGLLVGGFAPFVAHTFFGCWTAMHLGTWSSYAPFGPLGGFIVIDAVPNTSHQQRLLAIVVGVLVLTIGAACVASALYFAKWDRSTESGLFWGFAALNCIGGYHLCRLATRPNISHAQLNARINFLGRLVAGTAGLLLLLQFGWMGIQDPDGMWQHPYSPGNTATALSWLGIAYFGEQDTVSKRWQRRKKTSEPCATAAGSTDVLVQSEPESSKAQKRPKSACAAASDNV